ncbi:helix-turn-helix domain-containing protein [Oceanibaculum indicum]|uniref:Transcriptional regulator n=1 Tax=Oceanibaculum indicum P24 TaxID=1207063 RepID=K2IL67_9PROT|nr:helix-turn-helix transcriptional regulator [Oceanibaculum indicum]EKE70876.1 transcriptional regulator [Oceanibaculum indicum P24]
MMAATAMQAPQRAQEPPIPANDAGRKRKLLLMILKKDLVDGRLKALNKNRTWLAGQLGVTPSTITKLLKDDSQIKGPTIARLAEALQVDPREIMRAWGISTAAETPRIRIGYRITDDGEAQDIDETVMGQIWARRPAGLEEGYAAIVDTDALAPRYMRGELIFAAIERDTPIDQITGECIVTRKDGRRLLRTIQPSVTKGRYALVSLWSGKVELDAEIVEAAPIYWHWPRPVS